MRVSPESMSYSMRSKGMPSCARSRRALYPLPEDRLSCSQSTFPLGWRSALDPEACSLADMLTAGSIGFKDIHPSAWNKNS